MKHPRLRHLLPLLACAVVVAACDSKSGSGVTGTWRLDISPLVEAQRAQFEKTLAPQMEAMRQQMKQIEAMPGDQQEAARTQIWENVPAEHREIAKAMMAGDQAGVMRFFEAQMAAIKGTLEIKSDKTWAVHMTMGDSKDDSSGTWTGDGSSVTLVTTTKNGKPADAEDAKSVTLTLKDGKLIGTKDGQTIAFVR